MNPRLTTRDSVLCALFAAMTAVGAYIVVPMFGAIPFTLQVFFCLLAGLVLGSRLGAISMLVYLLLGLMAPVYAGGASGLGTLLGPSGGYIWAFVVAALLVGFIVERFKPRGIVGLTLAGLAGLVPIYGMGAAWLAFQLHTASFHVIIWGGILQFLPMDCVKAVMAGVLARALCAAQLDMPSLRRSERSGLVPGGVGR